MIMVAQVGCFNKQASREPDADGNAAVEIPTIASSSS